MRQASELSWAIELDNFGKSHPVGWTGRRAIAVHPLSLRLAPGEVLGLLGPNGSGKSTMLKALAGLITPSTGCCSVLGHPAGSMAACARIGYLPECVRFPSHQTGREFLRYCAALSSLPPGTAEVRIEELLAWSGLGAAADRLLSTWSKGMQQRLGLAQAILHDPPVVLLDEPGSGLDPAGRLMLVKLVRGLARRGHTVVFSSHLVAEAGEMCDRIALLGQGRLLAMGTPVELLGQSRPMSIEPSALEKLYLEKLHA